jgi:hypothetical protein
VKDFLDEPGLEELPQLHFDCSASLLVKAPQPLLHGSGVRWDIKGVLGDLPRDVSVFKPLDLHGRYPQQGRRWGSP